uniref:ZnMc domain-containing protein n=1 Tax=Rhabditophanes sp. KR3021 TaxID=114890 RepID=A0AC35U2F7_9BILA
MKYLLLTIYYYAVSLILLSTISSVASITVDQHLSVAAEANLSIGRDLINNDVQIFPVPHRRHHKLSESEKEDDALTYLFKYGYLKSGKLAFKDSAVKKRRLRRALNKFQHYVGLSKTGVLDRQTLKKMDGERCGNKDILKTNRNRRFILDGSNWKSSNITWAVVKESSKIPPPYVRAVMARAFKVWSQDTNLHFKYAPKDPNANIKIGFYKGHHGDDEPFDGKGGVLGHGFFPRYGGEVHFDDDEFFSILENSIGLSLFATAVHEIGHALGLKHSHHFDSVMRGYYHKNPKRYNYLGKDDIDGINYIYGKMNNYQQHHRYLKLTQKIISLPNSRHHTNIKPSANQAPDICLDASLDAITQLHNETIIVFKGDWLYTLQNGKYLPKLNKRISDVWPTIKGKIDAVITGAEGHLFFFQGSNFYLLDSDLKMMDGYPRPIKTLYNMKENVNAAFVFHYSEKPFIFKDEYYWRFQPNKKQLLPTNVSISSIFSRNAEDPTFKVPKKIDAALSVSAGMSYLFVDKTYYRIQNKGILRVMAGYPKDTGADWFEC